MKVALCLVALLMAGMLPLPAAAHYCSNIWTGPARLVVQPAQATLHVTAGSSVPLKVYMQNNFPYKLIGAEMRGSASGYTITVQPESADVGPGQKVLYTFSVEAKTTADIPVTTLNLQVKFRVPGDDGEFRGDSDVLVNQNPSQKLLVDRVAGIGSEQAPALSAATLIEKFATATLPATAPHFGRTGAQKLISWFGYRFCYDSGGGWRSGTKDCPTPTPEGNVWSSTDTFPQDCMRAGIELAAHKAKLGSALDAARAGAQNAVSKGGSIEHRCVAAVVGGLLWQGATDTAAFETALSALPSAACKAAGLRALGKGTASTCGTGAYHEKAACAAAEGLRGNDAPVAAVLVPNAGDGENSSGGSWEASLYYAYMLYLVTFDRYAKGQQPSWYPQVGPGLEAGAPEKDGAVGPAKEASVPHYNEAGQIIPDPDRGTTLGGEGKVPDSGGCGCGLLPTASARPALLLLAVPALLVLARRRRRR